MRYCYLLLGVLLSFTACGQAKIYEGELYDEIDFSGLDVKSGKPQFFFIKNGKRGYINTDNSKITAPVYDEVYPFRGGWAQVSVNKKYGFIDRDGKVIVPIEYDGPGGNYNSSVAWLKKGDKGAFYLEGKGLITGFQYDQSNIAANDMYYFVRQNGKAGFIDTTGRDVLKPEYEEAIYLNQDRFLVKLNNQWTIKRKYGRPFLKNQYEFLSAPNAEGLLVAKQNGKYGAIDTACRAVIPFVYEDLRVYGESPFVAKTGGKYGYINKSNKVVIPFRYEFAREFTNGAAEVEAVPSFHELINSTGEVIIPGDMCRDILRLDSAVYLTTYYSGTRPGDNEYRVFRSNKITYRTHNRLKVLSYVKDRILFLEETDNYTIIVDADGNQVINERFAAVFPPYFTSDYIAFTRSKDGPVGVYDLKKRQVKLEPEFLFVRVWGNICVVKKDKGVYLIKLE